MGTVVAIVFGYIAATEATKDWFYGHKLKPKRPLRRWTAPSRVAGPLDLAQMSNGVEGDIMTLAGLAALDIRS